LNVLFPGLRRSNRPNKYGIWTKIQLRWRGGGDYLSLVFVTFFVLILITPITTEAVAVLSLLQVIIVNDSGHLSVVRR
jgi:hypothetical protein